MKVVTVDTTVGGVEISPKGGRSFIHIQNPSDSGGSIFIKYDGTATALTVANGWEIAPGEDLHLNNDGSMELFEHQIMGISAGSIDVNVQGKD